jgi:hypothetical protein
MQVTSVIAVIGENPREMLTSVEAFEYLWRYKSHTQMTSDTFDCSIPAVFSESLDAETGIPLSEGHPAGLYRSLMSAMLIYLAVGLIAAMVWKLWHLLP